MEGWWEGQHVHCCHGDSWMHAAVASLQKEPVTCYCSIIPAIKADHTGCTACGLQRAAHRRHLDLRDRPVAVFRPVRAAQLAAQAMLGQAAQNLKGCAKNRGQARGSTYRRRRRGFGGACLRPPVQQRVLLHCKSLVPIFMSLPAPRRTVLGLEHSRLPHSGRCGSSRCRPKGWWDR